MSSVSFLECETIVFGKGIGESIVMRLSSNEWMIIDSCLDPNRNPAALEYLKSNGVDYENEVRLIMVSHFHDDHIKGLSKIISACKNAKLAISSALNTEEFKAYIKHLSRNGEEMARTTEINKIMQLLPDLHNNDRIIYAKRDCLIYRSITGIEVHSLSPCDSDITRSNLDFANSLKVATNCGEIVSSAKLTNPNHYCVVTRVKSPTSVNNEILLGADLENTAKSGWDAVCDALNSPQSKLAGIFKLPHHGSKTGYHQRTWDELLRDKPISILTTYDSSSLPREDMIQIYRSMSSEIYCTSEPKPLTKKDKNNDQISQAAKVLEKMKSTVKFSRTSGQFGYITVSNCLTPDPKISTFCAARAL